MTHPIGDKISDDTVVIERCHEFTIVDEVKVTSPYQLMPGKCINKPWLYGPAMFLETKTIIYPCSRFRCQIPCPCLLCAKQPPKCCQSINYILCPFLTLCSKMFPCWEWDTQVLSASATSRARSDLDERGILNKRHCLDTLFEW